MLRMLNLTLRRALIGALAGMALWGCRKPDPDPGVDLLPGDALGVVVDTSTLHAFSFVPEPVRTSGLTRNLLGSYLDPRFGYVRTGLVAQLRLSSNNVGASMDTTGLVADSLVLALAFEAPATAYGNFEAQVFQVFEVTDTLSVDSTYTTDKFPGHLPEDLVAHKGARIQPRPNTQPVVGNDTLQPQLRIKLDKSLADRFMNAFGTPDLADNNAFLQFFRGVYVTVNNGQQLPYQQGILHLNLLSSQTRATLYYRDTNSAEPDAVRTFHFPINQNSVRYTVAEFDPAQALDPALPHALDLADTTAEAPLNWVQALGGVRTAIRFPHLMELAGEGRLLARAELVLPLAGGDSPFLPPPSQLFIFRKDSTGADVFLPDQLSGSVSIGGLLDANAREYRFNITRYVQAVLAGELPNTGVEVVPGSNGISVNRAVIAGPAHAQRPMHLRLTFTTY